MQKTLRKVVKEEKINNKDQSRGRREKKRETHAQKTTDQERGRSVSGSRKASKKEVGHTIPSLRLLDLVLGCETRSETRLNDDKRDAPLSSRRALLTRRNQSLLLDRPPVDMGPCIEIERDAEPEHRRRELGG